jgi:toxin YoeB
MRFVFTSNGWEDYLFWQTTDRSTLKRVNRLLDDIARDPFAGIGKPEQLRHALAGSWSRRIDEEHRIVYLIEGDDIVILQARYHYT